MNASLEQDVLLHNHSAINQKQNIKHWFYEVI